MIFFTLLTVLLHCIIVVAAMVVTIACAVYGAMCGDRQWMPRPDLNFMSWG